MTCRSLLWWLRTGRRKQQQTQDEAMPRPQAIRVAPSGMLLPRVDPRPLRFSGKVIPFRLPAPEYVPPVTDKVWDQETADKLWQWAQDDAKGFTDSGDSQEEGA